MSPPAPRILWGWNEPARIMLAFLATTAALGLVVAAQVSSGSSIVVPPLVVDPNTAPVAVLVALPKLGPTLAGRIVAAREARPFRNLEDLDARVRGIGPATISALRPYLRVAPIPAPAPSSPPASPSVADTP